MTLMDETGEEGWIYMVSLSYNGNETSKILWPAGWQPKEEKISSYRKQMLEVDQLPQSQLSYVDTIARMNFKFQMVCIKTIRIDKRCSNIVTTLIYD